MQKLQFYALNVLTVEIADGLKHPLFVFARKTEDDMCDDFDSPGAQPLYGVFKGGEGIAPSQEGGGVFMNGLQAKLHPYRLLKM